MKNPNQDMLESNISKSVEENKEKMKTLCSSTVDLIVYDIKAGRHNCAVFWCDGMTNHMQSIEVVFKSLHAISPLKFVTPTSLFKYLSEAEGKFYDSKTAQNYGDIIYKIMAGCLVLMIDGVDTAIVVSVQGYNFRSISESYTEENVRSSREGFVEPIKINMTLVRRRIKSNLLVFESMQVGTVSNTDVAIVYLKDRVSKKLIKSVKDKLSQIKVELVLESGFIQPFLEPKRFSLFSNTGHTERPDTLCAKLLEGRIGILVDGTPFAIILPYLFTENFTCFDDYTNEPYYASMIRILKYIAFFISFLLPGLYVAIVNFNPELMPPGLLVNIAQSQKSTAFPLVFEALFIHFIYEIVREAGLRLPRPVGHAVSLIGGLVIGDAAINAGLIGSPMVMCVALTALCSFTIPLLYEPVTILRLSFIIIGGMFGMIGVAFGLFVVLINICAISSYGVPYTSPITPFSKPLLRDGILRANWWKLEQNSELLKKLNGADKDDGRKQ